MAEVNPAPASRLWVEPASPTLAELAQLLADAEALECLPQALWLVRHSAHGDLFLSFLETFDAIGATWAEVAVGLEQAALLVNTPNGQEHEALLAVGLPCAQLVAALRVRQTLGSEAQRTRASELVAQLAPVASEEQRELAIELARERG